MTLPQNHQAQLSGNSGAGGGVRTRGLRMSQA